jgi:hypothetical protein
MEIATLMPTSRTDRDPQLSIETQDKCETGRTQSLSAVHLFDGKVEQGIYYFISSMLLAA